jgi:soluble lytic murein transglycosylase-like protein
LIILFEIEGQNMKSMLVMPALIAGTVIASLTISSAFAEQDDAGVRAVQAKLSVPGMSVTSMPEATAPDPAKQGTNSRRIALAAPAGSDNLRSLVRRHAEANGVPFAIADAVVRVESRYNPRASNRGNYGLMQIRLQTARGVGYGGDASGLLNADTNARYGMKYLAQAYRMAGGDTCRTIMKYQSGHMATSLSGANRAYCSKVRTITARG